ncbi:hypothetical protein OC861_002941 [Tilletia horrida]|nr:hypothetical protein OC861_002941 [Tilletia horrida]
MKTRKRTIDTDHDAEDAARKRAKTQIPTRGQFSSLPVELVQVILQHLITLLTPKESIHVHENHQGYNRYLAEVSRLVLVNRLFNKLLTPHLYREIRFPRKLGYVSSSQHFEGTENPRLAIDESAVSLAAELKKRPELARLIKRIHLDPVARNEGGALKDCAAYTTILRKCKDTVEELAIAVNHCDAKEQRDLNSTHVKLNSWNLVLRRFQNVRMPKLKHLILKFDELKHLDWIAWGRLESLEEVTVLTRHMYHDDAKVLLGNAAVLDYFNLFSVLIRLPATVKKLNIGFVDVCGDFSVANVKRSRGPVTLVLLTRRAREFATQGVGIALRLAQDAGHLDHLDSIRVFWPHDGLATRYTFLKAYEGPTAMEMQMTYPLPRPRPNTFLMESLARPLTEFVDIPDHKAAAEPREGDATSSSKPVLRMYEVDVPLAYSYGEEDHSKRTSYGRPSYPQLE